VKRQFSLYDRQQEEHMDKIALVTGSTNNVGKGIAGVLSKDGFLTIVTSRHGDEAKQVAENLSQKGAYYQVDFSDAPAIEGLFSFIRKQFGRLDVLVNNVAYTKNESIMDCDLATWERTINTNLRSYYLCTRYAAQIMKDNGGGNIVNITIAGVQGDRQKFAYSVSKGGVNSLTRSAAIDLAPFNIRVNAIAIGLTGTPVGSKDHPDRQRTYENPRALAGHIGSPLDVANCVSFLVSEKAQFIDGAIMAVDGGFGVVR
jgi:NAD(P)-dependent dehydrogenase (short-subunit alcohol dehydrogenase family)